jgi:hypothetical protein
VSLDVARKCPADPTTQVSRERLRHFDYIVSMERGPLRRRIAARSVAALAAALLAPIGSTHAFWEDRPAFRDPVTVSLTLMRDDNINRAREAAERLADDVFSLSASQARHWPLTGNARLQLAASLGGDGVRRHRGLSRLAAGAEAALQYRSSGAFDATTLAIVGRASYEEFDSHLRSGPRYFLGLTAHRALTDRIELFLEAGANVRRGNSDVFNGRDHGARLSADYSLRGFGTLYLTGEFRRGDVVSSGGPSLVNLDIADVFVPDDAFDRAGMFAYRFEARTAVATLGWNYPLGARDALDLGWRRIRSTPIRRPGFDLPEALHYTSDQYSISYLMRF